VCVCVFYFLYNFMCALYVPVICDKKRLIGNYMGFLEDSSLR
jgi:hypothetical protein